MFLATTALSEFWDKEQEILFLGSWCLRHNRRAEWEGLKYRVLPSLWDDRKRFYDAALYLDECGERQLRLLADYLNSVHRVSCSQRYWRILIGPWLLRYLHTIYDRYIHLTEALGIYPDLQTITLHPQSLRTPRDMNEFISFVINDPYNLQIFSQILQELGYSFPVRLLKDDHSANGSKVEEWEWRGTAKGLVNGGLGLVEGAFRRVNGNKRQVALCEMPLPLSMTWKLARRSGFHAFPLTVRREWSFTIPSPVFEKHREILGALPSGNEFERIFVRSLPQNFPTLYLEAYQEARSEIKRRHPRIPPVIVSATGWHRNEPFKYLAAEASESGARLVTVQHGGGYGMYRFSTHELHETRVGDTFMAWGWADAAKPCRSLPDPKLSSLLNNDRRSNPRQTHSILFVATAHSPYLNRFHSAPVGSQWEDYFEWELRFLAAVSNRLRAAVRFRPYSLADEYGYAIRERISEKFSDVQWDDKRQFYNSMNNSRVTVIDHCGTTFLETLTANVPTVLFWNPQRWEVRADAAPYFQNLRKVGILWDSPEAAAAKVAEVYDEPWTWWGSESVQAVRRTFVSRYAFSKKDWIDCWVKAFEEEAVLSRENVQRAGGNSL